MVIILNPFSTLEWAYRILIEIDFTNKVNGFILKESMTNNTYL